MLAQVYRDKMFRFTEFTQLLSDNSLFSVLYFPWEKNWKQNWAIGQCFSVAFIWMITLHTFSCDTQVVLSRFQLNGRIF